MHNKLNAQVSLMVFFHPHLFSGVLEEFKNAKAAIMLCTDVYARGLDFQDIDWVIQYVRKKNTSTKLIYCRYDPPQAPDAFIHRIGRTARMGKQGKSLLFLLHNEDLFIRERVDSAFF